MELGTWVAPAWKRQLEPWGNYKLEGSKVLWTNPPSHLVGILPATWPKRLRLFLLNPPLQPLLRGPAPKGSSQKLEGDTHALPPPPTPRQHSIRPSVSSSSFNGSQPRPSTSNPCGDLKKELPGSYLRKIKSEFIGVGMVRPLKIENLWSGLTPF